MIGPSSFSACDLDELSGGLPAVSAAQTKKGGGSSFRGRVSHPHLATECRSSPRCRALTVWWRSLTSRGRYPFSVRPWVVLCPSQARTLASSDSIEVQECGEEMHSPLAHCSLSRCLKDVTHAHSLVLPMSSAGETRDIPLGPQALSMGDHLSCRFNGGKATIPPFSIRCPIAWRGNLLIAFL